MLFYVLAATGCHFRLCMYRVEARNLKTEGREGKGREGNRQGTRAGDTGTQAHGGDKGIGGDI